MASLFDGIIENEDDELKKQLEYHDNLYYNQDNPEISDAEYDALKSKYIDVAGEYDYVPGDVQPQFKRVEHTFPVKSLEKVNTEVELRKEIQRLMPVVIQPKFDGLTVVAYDKSFVSRGNGEQGEDITKTSSKIAGIKTAESIGLPVRLEAYISLSNFQKLNDVREAQGLEPFKNPRNAAAGMLRNKDASKVKCVDYFAYNILGSTLKETDQLETLKNHGFRTTDYWCFEDVEEAVEFVLNFNREGLDYEIDGLVIKNNTPNAIEKFSETNHHFKNAVAYKFLSVGKWTRLLGITYQTGRTGRITPVAEIEPVEILGSCISRVTLHNDGIMNALGITKDCSVYVIKANDVIPAIVKTQDTNWFAEKFEPIKRCPICGDENIETINNQKFCTNPLCRAKLILNIIHLAKRDSLDIEGLSEETAKKMIDAGLVKEPADIFNLTISDIITLEGFATKSAIKLFNAIQKARETELNRFIYATGIPGIGKSASADIANACGTLAAFQEDIKTGLPVTRNVVGIGTVLIENIMKYGYLLDNLKKYVTIKQQEQVKQVSVGEVYTFVITGTLSQPRSYYEELITNSGHKLGSSVSKRVNYLVAGQKVGATKLNKAQQLGVNIIGESELVELLAIN